MYTRHMRILLLRRKQNIASKSVWETTERVSKVPTDAQQNDLSFEMTPFERARIAHERNSSAFFNRSRAYYSIVIVATQPLGPPFDAKTPRLVRADLPEQ